MKIQTIYFDMDGTIADLYGVPNWLNQLRAESCEPYAQAATLIDLSLANELLRELQSYGLRLGVISWTAMNASSNYNKEVRKAKIDWLRRNFSIRFDEIHIVKYGTRKDYVAKDKNAIIFDDDEKVRNKWKGISYNPQEKRIEDILFKILNECREYSL